MVNDMGKTIAAFLYMGFVMVCFGIGLAEENAIMCCAAGLFAIAGEIAAKDGGKDNG